MTRDTRHLGRLPCWRGHRCAIIMVLIASIPVWLSPLALFASAVTHSAAVDHAKPARRGVETPDPSRLPSRQVQFFGTHTASEPEESVESATELEAPIVGTLPPLRLQHHPVISRLVAMGVQARLSALQSRALPLTC